MIITQNTGLNHILHTWYRNLDVICQRASPVRCTNLFLYGRRARWRKGFFRRIVMFTVGTCVIAGEYPLSCPGTDETQKRIACGEEKAKEKQKSLVDIRHNNGLLEEKKIPTPIFYHHNAEAESVVGRAKFFRFFFFFLPQSPRTSSY